MPVASFYFWSERAQSTFYSNAGAVLFVELFYLPAESRHRKEEEEEENEEENMLQ